MLRAITKKKIVTILDDSYFGISNFSVEYGDGAPLYFKVTFIPNAAFYYTVTKLSSDATYFRIEEAPGENYLKPEKGRANQLDDSIANLSNWIQRIKEEVLDASPVNRELQHVRQKLEERIASLEEDAEEFFTLAEAADLQAKLDTFANQMSELARSNAELAKIVEGLHHKISELQSATEQVNKGTWYRMAGSKFMGVARSVLRSKEAREFALEAAKQVLLEGPK